MKRRKLNGESEVVIGSTRGGEFALSLLVVSGGCIQIRTQLWEAVGLRLMRGGADGKTRPGYGCKITETWRRN